MTVLRTYLEQITSQFKAPYFPIERFVLAHGTIHKPQPLPIEFERGKIKQCYRNAALLTIATPKLTYAEGIAHRIIPVHHAWCVDKAGNVIDPTWDDPEQSEYMGVEIPPDVLMTELTRTRYFGLLDTPSGVNTRFMDAFTKAPVGQLDGYRNSTPAYAGSSPAGCAT